MCRGLWLPTRRGWRFVASFRRSIRAATAAERSFDQLQEHRRCEAFAGRSTGGFGFLPGGAGDRSQAFGGRSEQREAQRDLSIDDDRIGNVKRSQGDVPGALASYQAGLEIRRKLSAVDPSSAQGTARSVDQLRQHRRCEEFAGRSAGGFGFLPGGAGDRSQAFGGRSEQRAGAARSVDQLQEHRRCEAFAGRSAGGFGFLPGGAGDSSQAFGGRSEQRRRQSAISGSHTLASQMPSNAMRRTLRQKCIGNRHTTSWRI